MNKENNITMNEFAEQIRREQPHLMRYACYRLGDADNAKDALQEAYLKVCGKLSDEKGCEVRNWRNYIFRTLSNICTSWLSQSNRLKMIPLDAHFDMADLPTESNEADYQRIAQLLVEIPEEQAEVIQLRIYGNNSFADVAEILSLPLPTVKSRFLYGLEKIRRAMKQTKH
ncbi:MAG: RNA polymerase sigma factor [Bacteroidaceae bacterium]|nr:RNA polymerase sigma factor [Bacteroidaceae bacterium]